MRRLCLLAILALCAALPAQNASYTYFGGPGCSPFTVQNLPRPGAQMIMTTLGSFFGISRFLFTGFSNTTWNGLPLPLTQPGWCGSLLVSGEFIAPMPSCSNGNLQRFLMLSIPNDPTLIGLNFYNQGVSFVGGQVQFTQAGHGVIGT